MTPTIPELAKNLDEISLALAYHARDCGIKNMPMERAKAGTDAARFAIAAWVLRDASPSQVEEVWRGYLERKKIGEGD